MSQTVRMCSAAAPASTDTAAARKARGAFFTPEAITRFMCDWAIRTSHDRVLEPSAGDAAFLVEAVRRLHDLAGKDATPPIVDGVEIHPDSAEMARARVREAGGDSRIAVSDFFLVEPQALYNAVIGNPPFIRYQDFSGESRGRARQAALKAGVSLTALASSWAAFVVHSALFLRDEGRLALVLPAELLSVNYASTVRQFLFERFRSVDLVLFTEQVFPEAEADVVLLLADGFNKGPANHATVHQAQNARALRSLNHSHKWRPSNPASKWTGLLLSSEAIDALSRMEASSSFQPLQAWGETTLGMVTGNNHFFALSPQRAKDLGLEEDDLLRLCPPGSSHLRGLQFSHSEWLRMGESGRATWLFRPVDDPSPAALEYIATGHRAGVDEAYKCRVRKPWYQVPLVPPADLFLTCMNADTPRLTTNSAETRHLNSIHGVYLSDQVRDVGRRLLPLASLNSVTLLSAEIVGRSYGGGILKIEPREADAWAMPSVELVQSRASELAAVKKRVKGRLSSGDLHAAVRIIDEVLFRGIDGLSERELVNIREAHTTMSERRISRGRSGR